MRRKRIDVFFILYLTAIIGFVVVSKERDNTDERMQKHNERIIMTFLPRVPAYLDKDTVQWYVGADSSGIVTSSPDLFTDKVFVDDIGPDDEIQVSLHSVVRDSVLTTKDVVFVGGRTAFGRVENNTVYFPVHAAFPRTGTYTLNFIASAKRVHEERPGRFVYRHTRFDTTVVARDVIEKLEQSFVSLTVQVIDTSVSKVKSLEALTLECERPSISSAIGFTESNTLTVNLGWSEPELSIVHGFGRLERLEGTDRRRSYRWFGDVRSYPDTIVVEARLRRDAGGKDVVRRRFAVSGVTPLLRTPLPRTLYAGEDLNLDIKVAGLEEEDLYTWELFEMAGNGDRLTKGSGRGSSIQFRIPNSYGGKTLAVDARYRGRPYRYLSSRTHSEGTSGFVLPVQNPPVKIQLLLPQRASVLESFNFTASRYTDPRFRGEQPVERLADVRVDLYDEEDNRIRTDVSMIRKGEFSFIIQDKHFIRPSGERVVVHVHADGVSQQGVMLLTR